MTKLHELADLGQAIWLDYIRRSFTLSGDLQALVENGLSGVTSNPSIFEKAIAGSTDYDQDLCGLVDQGMSAASIYEVLALADIRDAADVLRPVYKRTERRDGYVSIEVSPALAYDTDGTVADAQRLWAAIDRPNVMIKVPATAQGIPAIRTLIGQGINVNATLMFSLGDYDAVSEAYLSGLERLVSGGGDLSKVASVASFFVSRVDGVVDGLLEAAGNSALQGKIAIANAKLAYDRFVHVFSGERWERLAEQGAQFQHPLWASTSTKNPRYSDVLYAEGLIGANTVNTLPPATLDAFRDHGTVALALDKGLDEAHAIVAQLPGLGIDLDAITQKLQDDGVAAFANSFDSLLASVEKKRGRFLAASRQPIAGLGGYRSEVDAALRRMSDKQIMARIWAHDHTVWQSDPSEITNRLGWLNAPEDMLAEVPRLEEFAREVRLAGYSQALLLGMGGSGLASEVFRRSFGVREGYLDLAVLDSTDPGAVLAARARLDLAHTLFVVSTKSGGTAETLALFRFFYKQVTDAVGAKHAGEHFAAITDPGSGLIEIAGRCCFRATFLNDPNIGGRYSALSHFGLVNAALMGIDLRRLLQTATEQRATDQPRPRQGEGSGGWLGTILGVLAKQGRDKLTLISSHGIAGFGNWLEQLIAESTGKEGRGILPVVGESATAPQAYGQDRLFAAIELAGEELDADALQSLEDAGHPVLRLYLRNLYDLGRQMYLWEMATAVAGHHLCIHPFDQPDVEQAKVLAREAVAGFRQSGELPTAAPVAPSSVTLCRFLASADPGDYVALQAYVTPTNETESALQELRSHVRDRTKLATTWGYGPRFLHSTGQLHKGDAGNGWFVQLTADDPQDVPIPDEPGLAGSSMTFGVLKEAQAQGDNLALKKKGRNVIRFHLGDDVVGGLGLLSENW